jgi:hypothetical protein
MKWS